MNISKEAQIHFAAYFIPWFYLLLRDFADKPQGAASELDVCYELKGIVNTPKTTSGPLDNGYFVKKKKRNQDRFWWQYPFISGSIQRL
jgi:hypothetical protein